MGSGIEAIGGGRGRGSGSGTKMVVCKSIAGSKSEPLPRPVSQEGRHTH